MNATAFDVLIGLRLAIVRRAADMLVVHFGDIRPHPSGEGTIGDYALHVQCPWRFRRPARHRDRPRRFVGIRRAGRAPAEVIV
jgi:hypothetical protein